MQMQLSFDVRIPDGLLAANALLNEKPHQGVPSWNPALHQGIDERNSTAAIGIRASAQLNRIWPRSTGKERDTESGNDYMFARYYNSSTGRFLSPDWSAKQEPVPYAKLESPQSLDLYGYVGNNPMVRVDPDGHVDWNALGNGLITMGQAITVELSAGFGFGVKSSALPNGGAFIGAGVFASSSGTDGIGGGYKADATISQGDGSGSQTARIYTVKDGEPVPVHDMQVEKDLPERKLGPVSTNGKEIIFSAEAGEVLSGGVQLSIDKKLAKQAADMMTNAFKSTPPPPKQKEHRDPNN